MKILHISTANTGGAAQAALRLHEGLLRGNIASFFLCLHRKASSGKEIHQHPSIPPFSFFKRQLRKYGYYRTQAEINQQLLKDKARDYEIFTFPQTDFDVASNPLIKEADIINLHWVANFLDWPSFFSKIEKPIVWTLHDMNPFQGGFHYHEDVAPNGAEFGTLEKRLREIKKKSLEGIQNLTIVTPTRWLMEESFKSEILGRFSHYHIHNGLDTDVFKPYSKELAREVFGLPKERKILLFVSDNTANRRKGIDLLQGALKKIGNNNMLAVAIGSEPLVTESDDPIHYLGRIDDERLMALAYAACDAFVIPSREDNLPNVMLEALACGRPVIGFPIGGVKEVVRPGFNGLLTNEVSPESLAEVLTDYSDGKFFFDPRAIREDAVKQFELEQQAGKYVELYQQILNEK